MNRLDAYDPSYDPYIEIAVHVLKNQDRKAIEFLKNFLTALPSPTEIEKVLTISIYRLAVTDRESCRWILSHPEYLMPELDVMALAQQIAFQRIKANGFLAEEDFRFDNQGTLQLSPKAKALLIQKSSGGERLIFESVL